MDIDGSTLHGVPIRHSESQHICKSKDLQPL
jgi:hypothetical protein